jgi:Ion channel
MTSAYFSGTTISTLGYGEFLPVHRVSRFLVRYEVFSGLFLVVMAIAIYPSRAINQTAPGEESGFHDERDDVDKPIGGGVDHV